jgi:hypothetical protein
VRPIIVRTLRRKFCFQGQSAASPLWYVEAQPSIEGADPEPTVLEIEHGHGFYTLKLPTGQKLQGTLRKLAMLFDPFTVSCGIADENEAVSLPAALLVSPKGQRVAFVGSRGSGKTLLALHLLAGGWAFEGDERIFIRSDGIAAHPQTLRLSLSLIRHQPQFAGLLDKKPFLKLNGTEVKYALDPQCFGREWRIGSGKVDAIFFLENNQSLLCSIRRIGMDEAFGRSLQRCTMAPPVTARGVGLLRSALSHPQLFHLQLGEPRRTVGDVSEAVDGLQAPA